MGNSIGNSLLTLAVSSTLLCSTIVSAQQRGSVIESQGFTPGQTAPFQAPTEVSTTPAAGNSDGMSLLLDQVRDLQAEVQALRGLVEEQGFEIRKLQRDSLSRYTNLDGRLTSLESTPVAGLSAPGNANGLTPARLPPLQRDPSRGPAPSSSNGAAVSQGSGNGLLTTPSAAVSNGLVNASSASQNLGASPLQPAVLSEQQLYQLAYDSVINSDFDSSIAEFDQYLSVYPEGRFVTNAHYWKGQAYLYLDRFAEAQQSYQIILEQFSDSPKLPDAMYGLGLAYEGLGDTRRARQLMNDIKRRFPNTGVANLADTRLMRLQ